MRWYCGATLLLILAGSTTARGARGILESGTSLREGPRQVLVPARESGGTPSPLAAPPASRRLDIVLVHYHSERLQPMVAFWQSFLGEDKVKALEPSVFVYCQNTSMEIRRHAELQPLFGHGGSITRLDNVGRESHAYLQHILLHWNSLADHTLFSQDIPDAMLKPRFLNMFGSDTGFLPLALVANVQCVDDWLPSGSIQQLYSIFTSTLCPPEGFTGAFIGQFLTSRQRIRAHSWWTYRHLTDVISAPEEHWIHSTHRNEHYKDRTNPFFGHVLERSWALAFNCYESWRTGNCQRCDNEMHMLDCGKDACQCFDV